MACSLAHAATTMHSLHTWEHRQFSAPSTGAQWSVAQLPRHPPGPAWRRWRARLLV